MLLVSAHRKLLIYLNPNPLSFQFAAVFSALLHENKILPSPWGPNHHSFIEKTNIKALSPGVTPHPPNSYSCASNTISRPLDMFSWLIYFCANTCPSPFTVYKLSLNY